MKSALSLLLALAAAWPAAASKPHPSTFVALAGSVLRIEAPRERGGFAMGSGVAVGPELVVTNCHVTREARDIQVVRGGVRWSVSAQAADVDRDLCLLEVPGLQAPPVPLGHAAALAIGQSVAALGYTGGIGLQNSTGEVVELHHHDGARVIQSTNWFSSGASGGGLFDGNGALVGVLTFRLRGGAAHYFAAPVEWVRQLLDERRRDEFRRVMPLDTRRVPYWQAPASAQPRFLRAQVLQRDSQWGELALLAYDWLRSDADDAEPWHLLGTALERLERPVEARAALECSLRLAPAHAVVRTQLDALRSRGTPTVDADDMLADCRPDHH